MIDLRLMQPPVVAPVALAKKYRIDICQACGYEGDCRENVHMGGAALCEILDEETSRKYGGKYR